MSNVINRLTDTVNSLARQQREYKTAQRRAANTIEVFQHTANVSVTLGQSADVWISGNGNTMMATISFPNVMAETLYRFRCQPIYDARNNRCGWRLYWRAIDETTFPMITFPVNIIANQEFSIL